MAYNPFDDVIENDPAYKMQIGGVQSMVIPQRRVDASKQEVFRPFASAIATGYKLLTPEQETLDQIEKDQQLRSLATQQAFQGTEFDEYAGDFDLPSEVLTNRKAMDLLDQAGFKRQSFTEGISRTANFLYGNQRKAFDKLRDGEQLTSDDRLSIALAPLDSLDFLLPPVALKKLAGIGLKNVNSILKSTSDLPEVQQVKQFFGGSPVPAIGGRAEGPPGMVTEPRITLAKEDGTGLSGQALATKVRTENLQQRLYEPYRDIYTRYTNQTDNPSARGFLNFLKDKNIPLTKGISKDPRDTSDIRHIEKAINFLTEGKATLEAFKKPWELRTEEILKNSDRQLLNIEVKRKLAEEGFDIPLTSIGNFVKGKKIDTDAAKNIIQGSGLTANRKLILSELEKLRDDLVANPEKQGKGLKQYSIETPGMKQGSRTIGSIITDYRAKDKLETTQQNITDIVPASLIDEIENLVKVEKGEGVRSKFREYIPSPTKVVGGELPQAQSKIADLFRTQFFLQDEQGKVLYDFRTIEGFEDTAKTYGIEAVPPNAKNARQLRLDNAEQIKQLAKDIEILQAKNGYLTQSQIQGYKQVIDESKQLSEYTNNKFRQVLSENPQLKQVLIDQYKQYYTKFPKTKIQGGKKVNIPVDEMTEEDFINAAAKTFDGHLSHVFRIEDFPSKGKGMFAMGDVSNLVRSNYGIENLALQQRGENAVDLAIASIRKKLNKNKNADIQNEIDTLRYFDKLFTRKGMAIYRRLKKNNLTPEVISQVNELLGKDVAGTIRKVTNVDEDVSKNFNSIFLGSEQPLTLQQNKDRFDSLMDYYIQNPNELKVSMDSRPSKKENIIETFPETPYFKQGFLNVATPNIEQFTNFKKGGVSMVRGGVQMAIGGQNFTENMNRQDFTPDPAIDGDSAFQQAVQSGNLQALNLPKIFKGLGEAFGVFTPKKVGKPLTGEMSAVSPVAKSDFPLQSFTLEKINNLNIQSARPQDWINELQGGAPAPKSELLDSGLFQYLADFEKYFPNQKVSKDKLVEFLEDNPISNLKIKIKGSETGDPAYDSYMGKPRHKNAGSARMDQAGEDYREVIIEAGTLPGQQTGDEFVNSSHFQEKNVLAFGRVGTYKNSAGDNVAVIQEMQTDYLTQVRKEQELLNAEIEKLNAQKVKAEQTLERVESPYDIQRAAESLAEVNSKLPALLKLQESKLIKPYPNVAAADKIPEFNKQLQDLQKQINNLSMQGVRRENPEFLMQISNLEEQQKQVLNQLLDLNRANEYEMLAKDVKVPDIDDRDNLLRYVSGADSYVSMKNVKTFPPTPLNNQADYVDAILKAVIKDAENRGINKIAIMPADVGANARWNKESEDAKRKFRNLYDKVGVQRLKDIAKKYGGTVEEEFVVDSTKGALGLRFLNKDVDGNFQVLKETDIDPSVTIRREDLGPSKPPEGLNAFLNEEILRVAKDYGPNEVVFRREIAPGQTMEYFVNVKQGDVVDQKFDLVPLGDADRADNATIVIEEYNPQLVKMNVLVLPDSNKDKPMYLFKKKKGGIMPDDRLVSITDIYGDY
jgi:hypothetical protein